MEKIEFFKQQAKNFLKDYHSRVYNESEGFYDYNPRFFVDIEDIVLNLDIEDKEKFTLMNAQHVVAKLAGFDKWNDLIKASDSALELGKLLLINRVNYQEKQGFMVGGVASLIVEDWNDYVYDNLFYADDDTKLEIFKHVFLNDDAVFQDNKVCLDFSDNVKQQDMLAKLVREKNMSLDKAIKSAINDKNFIKIIEEGYAGFALSLWGHANPDSEFEKLDNAILEIRFSKQKNRLLNIIMEKEKVSLKEAVLYFILFELHRLGYHI